MALKIHFNGLCEIAEKACERVANENGKDYPDRDKIAAHLQGNEMAVRKEFEPLIDGIADALKDDCGDWPVKGSGSKVSNVKDAGKVDASGDAKGSSKKADKTASKAK